jgi:short-subunit dehydrogenase
MENIRDVYEVNVFGAINCIQGVFPRMKERRYGMIINVSSVAGKMGTPYSAAYSGTKAAIAAIGDALRLEVEQHDIRVCTVYPGYTVTEFQENLRNEIEQGRPSRLLRGATAAMVARAIVGAARRNKRETYVTLGDRLAVAIKSFSPRLVDFGMRRLWLAGRKFD